MTSARGIFCYMAMTWSNFKLRANLFGICMLSGIDDALSVYCNILSWVSRGYKDYRQCKSEAKESERGFRTYWAEN